MLRETATLIAQNGGTAAEERIVNGLDRILGNARIETYHYNVALATEMLFAAYGAQPDSKQSATILGYTEDCLPALEAMNMPCCTARWTVWPGGAR